MSVFDKGTAEIVLQPVRFKIIRCLQESDASLYIEQIAERVQESSRLVSHNLGVLEDLGLVTSEFRLVDSAGRRPAAARFFRVTPKLALVLHDITDTVSMQPRKEKRDMNEVR